MKKSRKMSAPPSCKRNSPLLQQKFLIIAKGPLQEPRQKYILVAGKRIRLQGGMEVAHNDPST
jgi:hypothetical protein